MLLKVLIVITFVSLVISLASGFVFLVKDEGKTKRTLHSLGVRVSLASLLLFLIGFGVISGELKSQAPWAVQSTTAPSVEVSSAPVE